MGKVGEDSVSGHSATRRRIVGKAQSKLRLAKTLMTKKRAKGKRWLREVIEGFPTRWQRRNFWEKTDPSARLNASICSQEKGDGEMQRTILALLLLSIAGCSADVETQQPTSTTNGDTPAFRIGDPPVDKLNVSATEPAENAPISNLGSPIKLVDPNAKVISGQVVSITDGDTLIVLDENKTQHKIRLDGIDTPETGQAFGSKAKQALGDKVFQKSVRVEWKERGRYKRIIGTIYLDDRNINKEMVEEGWAWHYKQYSDDEDLAAAERGAKAAGRGLWADPKPIPPWDYRHNPNLRSVADTEPGSTLQQPAASQTENVAVYVTRTGAKYHRGSCRYLRKSKIPISLSEAKRRYGACLVCKPPQ
jgi:endonuclease YncB( thermonuclease family)